VRAAPVDFPDLIASSSLPIAVKLEAYYAGQWLGVVPFDDATIDWDDGSLVAGTLKFSAPDPASWWVEPPLAVRWQDHGGDDETPEVTSNPLGTDGHRIRVSYGLERPGGRDTAWVQIGWFRISDAVPDGAMVNVTAPDLMDGVQRARFVAPKSYPPGFAYLFVVDQLVYPLVPNYITDNGPGSMAFQPMPAKSWERERLDALQEVLDSMPAVGRLDSSGTLVVDPANVVPLAGDVIKSGPGGNAVSVRKVASPDAGYNACVAVGRDSAGQDIMGVAYILNGPRRWDGPYGRNPGFYASDMMTTLAQCRSVAVATLDRWQRRQAESWRVEMAPDPRLELGDRRPIVFEESGVGNARTGVCTSVKLKLTAAGGAMVADFAMEG
jgi:hypothetical protein